MMNRLGAASLILIGVSTTTLAQNVSCASACQMPLGELGYGTDFFYTDEKVVIFATMPPDPSAGYERLVQIEQAPFAEGEPNACFIITEVVNDGTPVPLDEHGAQFIDVNGTFISEEMLTLGIHVESCEFLAQ